MRRRAQRKPPILPKPPAPSDLLAEAALQRARQQHLQRYDDLPQSIRQALSQSPFDLHIGMKNRHWNEETMVKRIAAVRSEPEALAFNDEFAARRFGFHAFG